MFIFSLSSSLEQRIFIFFWSGVCLYSHGKTVFLCSCEAQCVYILMKQHVLIFFWSSVLRSSVFTFSLGGVY